MIKDRLKELRKKNGITQVEFAKTFNISNGTVGNWESGTRQPDNEMLTKIADYYGVSVDFILDREKDPSKEEPATDNEKLMMQLFRSAPAELQDKFLFAFEMALRERGILQ